MRIVIEIDTDGAAFENDTEVFNMMRRASMHFHDYNPDDRTIGDPHTVRLFDRYGNTCGKMEIQ